MSRQKNIRHVGEFEYNHPIIYFLTARPFVWLGKVWLRLLTGKHHLWAMAGLGQYRRLMWFGPAEVIGQSRSTPLLVIATGATKRSLQDPVGDYEPSTEHHD